MVKTKIGLEVHCQLNTKTKMFCGCSLKNISEAEPNSRCCPTCLGMAGSKPRVNKKTIEAGIKVALALNCKINKEFFFSRKSYFYPDMSKNFQITQYEIPLAKNGFLEVNGKKIRIRRINLEEDPAKLAHIGGSITEAKYVLVDYNRSGVPLCEIVTEPDFESPKEARLFLQNLSMILEYLKVFTIDEFSLKSDANISLEEGQRIEIKNITGFKEIEKALNYEIIRQKNILRRNKKIEQETRAWDTVSKVTRLLRKKEGEEDYGYIFEPDLTKISLKEKQLKEIQKSLPELPQQKRERYKKDFSLNRELAYSISSDLELAVFFENIIKKINPKLTATWILVLKKTLNYNNLLLKETKLTEKLFIRLLKLIESEKLSDKAAELIIREIILKPEKFDELVKKYEKFEVKQIEKIIDSVLKKNKKAVNDYKKGEKKALEFLIGQIIRETKGKADAKEVRKVIEKRLR